MWKLSDAARYARYALKRALLQRRGTPRVNPPLVPLEIHLARPLVAEIPEMNPGITGSIPHSDASGKRGEIEGYDEEDDSLFAEECRPK